MSDDPTHGLPWSEDAEKGLLSCCLLDEAAFVGTRQRAATDHFHKPAHRTLWARFLTLADAGSPLDPVIIQQALIDAGEIDNIGGPSVISELFSFVSVARHWQFYLDILEEKRIRRAVLHLCTEGTARALGDDNGDGDGAATLEWLEAQVFALRKRGRSRDFEQVGPKVTEVLNHLETVFEHRGHVTDGLATGFTDFDRTTMGLKGGQVIVIAARPAMGKSALAMNIAENIATGCGHYREFNQPARPVGVVTLEMGAAEILQRAILGRAGVNLMRARDGLLHRDDPAKLAKSAGEIGLSPLYILDAPKVSIQDLHSLARLAVRQHGLQVLVIDYLQLMCSSSKRAQMSRQIEIGEITSGLKELAKELDIPIIVLAQVSRKAEDRKDGVPGLAHLRESGDIEQDADIVAFLWRPAYYDDDAPADEAVLAIAKHRGGPVGEIKLKWTGWLARFDSTTADLFSNSAEKRQQS